MLYIPPKLGPGMLESVNEWQWDQQASTATRAVCTCADEVIMVRSSRHELMAMFTNRSMHGYRQVPLLPTPKDSSQSISNSLKVKTAPRAH